MSFKGIGKAVIRAPQSLKYKFNMGEQTNDPIYQNEERRFKELELEIQKLVEDSKRYFTAVNGMLKHQIGFARAMEELFKPIGVDLTDFSNIKVNENSKGIEASEDYCRIVEKLKETLKPDLELIETRVVMPAQKILSFTNNVRKMITKRSHKLLDLDRRIATYKKYESKKDRNVKDNEKLLQAERDLEVAEQEYDYYNNILKQELPQLFRLEKEILKPLFIILYYIQLSVFYALHTGFQDMRIAYFDLNSDIVQPFHARRGDIAKQAENLSITQFRAGYSKAKFDINKNSNCLANSCTPKSPTTQSLYASNSAPPPSYHAVNTGTITSLQYPNPPPPPSYIRPTSTPSGYETCTALYEFTAIEAGDLSFPVNAVIEIEDRSDSNGWWTGRYNGMRGNFPGNYVKINKN